jgi:hypothetical protein
MQTLVSSLIISTLLLFLLNNVTIINSHVHISDITLSVPMCRRRKVFSFTVFHSKWQDFLTLSNVANGRRTFRVRLHQWESRKRCGLYANVSLNTKSHPANYSPNFTSDWANICLSPTVNAHIAVLSWYPVKCKCGPYLSKHWFLRKCRLRLLQSFKRILSLLKACAPFLEYTIYILTWQK